MFEVNQELLEKARNVFAGREQIYWILGGSCSGKSTISRAITEAHRLTLIDMDALIYDGFMGRYDDNRHPANRAWLSASNPLAWQLALSPAEFDAFYRAASAEYLDLLAEDLAAFPDQPLLLDGGLSHPSLLAGILPPERLACLEIGREQRASMWETDPERAMMREWIGGLPDPDAKWQTFLRCDEQMSTTMVREAEMTGIRVFFREETTPVTALAEAVAAHLGLV